MLTSLFPYFAPTYIVIPESRYAKYQLEELENRLSIVDAQLDTLSDTKKELDTLKSELVDKIKELKQTK